MASNYTDKAVDLVAWHDVTPVGWSMLSQCLFNKDHKSEVCAGIQRLVQRWLIAFLTPTGSMKFDQNKGTPFMVKIFTACTEADVFTIFTLCNSYATEQLKEEETDTMDNDERLESVNLDSIELALGNLKLYITITSRAGTDTNIILPIATNPVVF